LFLLESLWLVHITEILQYTAHHVSCIYIGIACIDLVQALAVEAFFELDPNTEQKHIVIALLL
jgi:hypothetical protein